jgi:hypothetical protein
VEMLTLFIEHTAISKGPVPPFVTRLNRSIRPDSLVAPWPPLVCSTSELNTLRPCTSLLTRLVFSEHSSRLLASPIKLQASKDVDARDCNTYTRLHASGINMRCRHRYWFKFRVSMLVFRVFIPCGLAGRYKRFGGRQCLHLQDTSTLKMEAVYFSEMLPTYNSWRCYSQ